MKEVSNLKITKVPIEQLSVHPHNARQGDIGAIVQSLEAHGQYRPIVVQKSTMRVLAGNHTLQAARSLGWKHVEVVTIDVDDDQALRILLVDNRTNDLADYDKKVLTDLLESLVFTDFGLEGTGFIGDDLDEMLNEFTPEVDKPDESVDAPLIAPPKDPITKTGDVWLLGPHRLICGDSRNADDVRKLMNGTAINVAFTSPPYAQQRTYDESSGFKPIPPDEYVEWYAAISENVKTHLASDGSYFINIRAHAEDGERVLYVYDLVAAHKRLWQWLFVDDFVWVDSSNGVPGAWPNRFKDAWEPVFHFSRQRNIKFNPLANGSASDAVFAYDPNMKKSNTGSGLLGEKSQAQEGIARPSNVITMPTSRFSGHSAAFPIKLPEWFIKAYSDEGDAIYDPFMGSGSTIIAAHNNNRIGYGVELSPAYCDVICRRFQDSTAITPILESTGEAVSFVGFND